MEQDFDPRKLLSHTLVYKEAKTSSDRWKIFSSELAKAKKAKVAPEYWQSIYNAVAQVGIDSEEKELEIIELIDTALRNV